MKKPNTFIIGAPKCGTTAMCSYLGQHPHVFVSDPKEPHFFARYDMPDRQEYYKTEDSYIELYSEAENHHRVLVDGSVWYLYCEKAVELIAAFDPTAKIVVMLRRPDEMVHSFHSQALQTFDEDVSDFEAAWGMAIGDVVRDRLPKHCRAPSVLRYDKICSYATQLSKVYEKFSPNQVHVIFFEDFSADTKKTYEDVLSFLELPVCETVEFNKVNPNSSVKNRLFGQFLQHPPRKLVFALTVLKKILRLNKIGLREKLISLNTSVGDRDRLKEGIRAEIIAHYRDDILLLQKIVKRDLSSWLN